MEGKKMIFSDNIKLTDEVDAVTHNTDNMSLDQLANDGKPSRVEEVENDINTLDEENNTEDEEVENNVTVEYKKYEKPDKILDIDKSNPNIVMESAPKKEEYIIPKNLDSIEFPEDEDEEETEVNEEVKDSEIINNKLKESVKSKIKTVAKKYDLSAFTISKKPVALNAVLDEIECPNRKAADWVAFNTGHKFRMLGFTGAEIDKLSDPGGNRIQTETVRYKMLYDHIIDADKPATMEQWAKVTSYYDIQHYWFGAFRSTFEGEAYIPITNCPNDHKHVFLTDNLDVMDFVKFENDEAKQRFNDIYTGKIGTPKSLYKTELVPVSEDFAISFREPSIYNMVFEIAALNPEFVEKYKEVITLICYIDEIYYINKRTMSLDPVEYRHHPNNTAKTAKSRIIQYSKAIRKLSSDQYHAVFMYIQEVTKRDNALVYQIPETTCIECNATIPAAEVMADELVFTRHRLAALAAL